MLRVSRRKSAPQSDERAARREPRPRASGRESAESLVGVLLILLVMGIGAEGLVIPTGSMAPTLLGRHKEITCPQCGLEYAVNADRESEPAPWVRPEGAPGSRRDLRQLPFPGADRGRPQLPGRPHLRH